MYDASNGDFREYFRSYYAYWGPRFLAKARERVDDGPRFENVGICVYKWDRAAKRANDLLHGPYKRLHRMQLDQIRWWDDIKVGMRRFVRQRYEERISTLKNS